MIAILGGLGAALCWTISALCAAAASQVIGAESTLAWVMTIGLVLVVPLAGFLADPAQLSARMLVLLAAVGISNVAGLRVEYAAFRQGKVGVVTAIASTEGAIAAAISAVAGSRLSGSTAALLGFITLGVVLTAASPDHGAAEGLRSRASTRAAFLAIVTAILFGICLYTTGRAGAQVSVLWVVLPARLFGTAAFTAPLAWRRKLQLTRRMLPLVAAAGAAEVLGILSYSVGARHQLAVAAVLASQFAALAAVAAYFLHRQRLSRWQMAGVAVVIVGVTLLSIVSG